MTLTKTPTNNLSSYLLTAGLLCSLLLVGCSTRQDTAKVSSGSETNGQVKVISESKGPPELGVVVNEEHVVLSVDVGGAAELAGVQPGDRLEMLDDLVFAGNQDKVKEHIHNFTHGAPPLTLKLLRGGKEISIPVTPGLTRPRGNNANQTPLPTVTPAFAPNIYY